jgi:sirohydrochlorin cobaltochelatase
MSDAIILFAHGARDPEWARPFQRIRDKMLARQPDAVVVLAFLELASPSLEQAVEGLVARGHSRIRVVPLFMAQGGHLKRDLPQKIEALRKRYPQLSIDASLPIGDADDILDAIANWAARKTQDLSQ